MRRILLAVSLLLGSWSASAQVVGGAYYDIYPAEERMVLQLALIWTGDYAGMLDADFGPATMAGIRAFQARTGFPPDGGLSEHEARVLLDAGQRAMEAVGFDSFDDSATGARIWLPLGLVRYVGPTEIGSSFISDDGAIYVGTLRGVGLSLAELYDVFRSDPESTVTYQAWGGSWFVVGGYDSVDEFYIRVEARGNEVRGYSLYYERRLARLMAPVTVAMSNLYIPFYSTPSAPRPAATPAPAPVAAAPAPPPVAQEPTTYYGTGFVIAADGTILTNAHVVEGCSSVTVGEWGVSSRISRDETNDLALIRPNGWIGVPLTIATISPRLGDEILVFGYPLAEILAESLNVTQGIVSSIVGPGNDSRLLQISAGVNPGNSGGPLLNDAGQVVGVVTARLNDQVVLEAVGALPATVAFAVRREVILAFLAAQGVQPAYDGRPERAPSIADVAARVEQSIVPLSCVSTQ